MPYHGRQLAADPALASLTVRDLAVTMASVSERNFLNCGVSRWALQAASSE
jgi:hypothetical protein